MNTLIALLAAVAASVLLRAGWQRLLLSRAKHRSLAGHVRWAKRIAALIPGLSYDHTRFFDSDGAPSDVATTRREALDRLEQLFHERFPRSLAATQAARAILPDLRFTGAYRVPFQYSRFLRERLPVGAFVRSTRGFMVEDLDGNVFYDLTGSYGVNLFGHAFYKECIARGASLVQDLGVVLGPYHPCVADNAARLAKISGMDDVSFHMSGTEAVMQAVRLARYHTGRTHLVRFAGAYHGWWGDVQPGPGNPLMPHETYTLAELSDATLRVLKSRRDIACVLVNPLQALHPNASAPGDSSLVDSSRGTRLDRAAYTDWLRRLREVCSERGIVLIFDEVFTGFRLARGGAQEYFGVRADLVTYGKSVGGGLPIGVLCGRSALMNRYREERPADVCFARGTFNAHPYVMGAMHEFLARLEGPDVSALYEGLDARWDGRAARLNQALAEARLPVRVANLSTIFTVSYTRPSRYNWMFQYYLRAAGLQLSWVGTGRLIFSLDYADPDFDAVGERFIEGARRMAADGWWWEAPGIDNAAIRRRVLGELGLQALARFRPGDPRPPRRSHAASDRSTLPAEGTAEPGDRA
jgi:glutamate-1-semialdehyde 2,1-aminomutase